MEGFVCGGAAAISSICVMHPVDVIKTRMQLQGEAASHSSSAYRGVVPSLIKLAQHEGVRGMYRGLGAACCLQFCVTGTRFGTYALGKRVLGVDRSGHLEWMQNFMLAMVAGVCGAVAGNPFYTLKTRFQAMSSSANLAVGHQHAYTGLLGALADIYRTEGIKGYWRGVNVFIPRVVAYSSMQLSTYDLAKGALLRQGVRDGVPAHIAASSVAAVFAITVMQPFDFIAARVMNQPSAAGRPAYYTGALDCLQKSVKAEGASCLFKGASANYARMVPYTILLFVFFEQYKKVYELALAPRAHGRHETGKV